ncbi:hypothetical protein V1519DRAFT_39003 [Lipomyces tetrasporus]
MTAHDDSDTHLHLEKMATDKDDGLNEDIDALLNELESDEEFDDTLSDVVTTMRSEIADELLQTDPKVGLTEEQVVLRRKKYGLNQMREEKGNLVKTFLMYFVGPIQFVMEAAAILAAALQDWVDFGVICALLLLNAVVGFIQEFQAGSIVDELKKTLAQKATALRDGVLIEIDTNEVVPGDIIQLEEVRLWVLLVLFFVD